MKLARIPLPTGIASPWRGQARARHIAHACGSSFPERRAMLTAAFIVAERFPMLRQSFHWNDGPDGFLIDMAKAKLRREIEANFRERLLAKYRRMMALEMRVAHEGGVS